MNDLNGYGQWPMTRADFEAFLKEFADSLRTDPTAWTNVSLEQFLGGVSGWVADMDGYFANRGEPVPSQPSWQLFAQALLAGRVYE